MDGLHFVERSGKRASLPIVRAVLRVRVVLMKVVESLARVVRGLREMRVAERSKIRGCGGKATIF